MPSRRLVAVAAGLATVALAFGGCGVLQETQAPLSESMATIKGSIEQTIYTAVDFVGRDGLLSGYRQMTAGHPLAGTSELWWTGNDGRSWHKTSLRSWQVAQIEMVSAKVGYLTAMDPAAGYAVLRTADGGRSWREVLPLAFEASIIRVFSAEKALVLSNGDLFSTTDAGRHWHEVAPDVPGIAEASFLTPLVGYAVSGTNILATRDGGVHWQVQYALPQSLVVQLGTPEAATIDVRPGAGGWASFELSTCWPGGCPNVVVHQGLEGPWRIVSGEDAGPLPGVAASEDGFPGGAQALLATGPGSAVWNGAGGLWQTTDSGASWQELGAPKAQQPSPAFVAVSGVRQGDIWAVGLNRWGGYLLHRTKDGWQQLRPQPFPVSAVDFVTPEVGFGIGLGWDPHAVVATRDGGRSWQVRSEVEGSLPIALDFSSAENGYLVTAGSGGTLWQTADGGRTWHELNALDAPPVSLDFRDADHGVTLLETGPGWPLQFSLRQTVDGGRTWSVGSLPESLAGTLSSTTPIIVTSAAAVFPGLREGYFLALVGREPQFWRTKGASWQAVDVPVASEARGSGAEQYRGAAMTATAADAWLVLQPAWSGAPVRVLCLGAAGWQIDDLPLPIRLDLPEGSEAVSAFGSGKAVLLTNLGPLETLDGGRSWRRL